MDVWSIVCDGVGSSAPSISFGLMFKILSTHFVEEVVVTTT